MDLNFELLEIHCRTDYSGTNKLHWLRFLQLCLLDIVVRPFDFMEFPDILC